MLRSLASITARAFKSTASFVGRGIDPIAKGAFISATAPLAMMAAPAFAVGQAAVRGSYGVTKAVARGAVAAGRRMLEKDNYGVRRAYWAGAALGGAIVPVGVPYMLGRKINQKMREKDRTTMGLPQALYHVHG